MIAESIASNFIKYFINNGAKPNNSTLSYAVATNNFKIVKLILEEGDIPDQKTMIYAFNYSDIQILIEIITNYNCESLLNCSYGILSTNPHHSIYDITYKNSENINYKIKLLMVFRYKNM